MNALKCKRSAKWSKIKAERAMSCQWCGHHIHPTVGTIFENSQTSLQIWFYAMYLFTITKNGVSAKELQRTLGVTYKTAWRIGHKIREHMANVDGEDMLGGPGKAVEADETFVGGHTPNGQGGKGCTFRIIRPVIPTTSGHLYRGIRPPLYRWSEALGFR